MRKAGKVILFAFICLTILVILTVIKVTIGGTIIWLGAVVIPIIYIFMFGKNDNENDDQNKK